MSIHGTRRGPVVLAAGLTAVALAVGCGDDEEPTSGTQPTQTASATETAAADGSALEAIRQPLEDAGYTVDPTEPAKDSELEALGGTEGYLISKGDVLAEAFLLPSAADAQKYADSLTQGTPVVVSGEITYAGALDDDQSDIDEIVAAAEGG